MPLTGCKLVHVQTVVEIVLVTNFKHAYAVANMTKKCTVKPNGNPHEELV